MKTWGQSKTVTSFLLVFSAILSYGRVVMGEEALDLLNRAIKATTTVDFKSIGYEVFHANTYSRRAVAFQQLILSESDGSEYIYRRADHFRTGTADASVPDAVSRTMIMNHDGVFAVSGRKAIKLTAGNLNWLPPLDSSDITTASMERVAYNGISCWRIVLVLAENHVLHSVGIGKIEATVNERSSFIHAWTSYDKNDMPLKTIDFGDVDFINPPSVQTFALQDGTNVIQDPSMDKLNAKVLAELEKANQLDPVSLDHLNELNRMIEKTNTANFKSIAKYNNQFGGIGYKVYYQLTDPTDGFTFQRMDFVTPASAEDFEVTGILEDAGNGQSNIKNRTGIYLLFYNKEAARQSVSASNRYLWRYQPIPSDWVADIKVSRREFQMGDSIFIEYLLDFPSGHPFAPQESRWPQVDRFLVRQSDEFVCLHEVFDSNGDITESFTLGDPDLTAQLTSDMFDLPKNANISPIDNESDLRRIIDKADEKYYFAPRRPSILSRIGNWLSGVFGTLGRWCTGLLDAILDAHPVFLLLPAAVSIPAIVIIKKKRGMKTGGRPAARRPFAPKR